MIEFYKSSFKIFIASLILLLIFASNLYAQDTLQSKRKTYYYHEVPYIEDNSFFIEEAFNQDPGIIQFISFCHFSEMLKGNMTYTFTQEIPLKTVKHQLTYSVAYSRFPSPFTVIHGLGDIMVSYKYELAGEEKWARITPGVSLIIPTGDIKKNLGYNAWGGQINFPLSKMISNKISTHYNIGYTFYKNAHYYNHLNQSEIANTRNHLNSFNIGASIVWHSAEKVNLMLEYLSTFNDEFDDNGNVSNVHQKLINPGIRFGFDLGNTQVVPGISMPLIIKGEQIQLGSFIYLSFEPNYKNQ